MDKEKLLPKTEREAADNLASELLRAFSWRETHEGVEFWQDIEKRLIRIAEKGK